MWQLVLVFVFLMEASAASRCPQLEEDNSTGKVWALGSSVGDTAWYVCRPGYTPSKVQECTCKELNGTVNWVPNPRNPLCQSIECGNPPSFSGATLLNVSGTAYGRSVAIYQCKESYMPNIEQEVHCQFDGKWSELGQKCLPLIESRSIGGLDLIQIGASALQYLGSEGGRRPLILSRLPRLDSESKRNRKLIFQLKTTSETLACVDYPGFLGSTESWIRIDLKSAYTVIQVRVELSRAEAFSQDGLSAYVGNSLSTNITSNAHCGSSYDSNTQAVAKDFNCSPFSTERYVYMHLPKHETAVKVCSVEITVVSNCGPPPAVQYAIVSVEGKMAFYNCRAGFSGINESISSLCKTDGQWENVGVKCKPQLCSDLEAPPNGYLDRLDFFPGINVTINCMSGFARKPNNGSAVQTCGKDKTWSGVNGNLRCVTCSPPVTPRNGYYCCSDFRVGSNLTFTCSEGHQLVGNVTAQCTAAGVWNKPPPKCKPIPCGSPPLLSNGNYSTTPLNCILYYCHRGYKLFGESSSCCKQNGMWSPSPQCKEIQCKHPPSISNGYFASKLKQKLTPGNVVSYSCRSPYKMKGRGSAVCDADGNWNLKASCYRDWGSWGSWSQCSRTCGRGMVTRKRTCSRRFSKDDCTGLSEGRLSCCHASCTRVVSSVVYETKYYAARHSKTYYVKCGNWWHRKRCGRTGYYYLARGYQSSRNVNRVQVTETCAG